MNCCKKNPCVECNFCKEKAFCSDKCKEVGWSIHQSTCPNVFNTPHNVFGEIGKTYLVRSVDPKGFIVQKTPEIPDEMPSAPNSGEPVLLKVDLDGEEIFNKAIVTDPMIGRRLAQLRSQPANLVSGPINVPVPREGVITVTVGDLYTCKGVYSFPVKPIQSERRAQLHPIQAEYKAKTNAVSEDLRVLRAVEGENVVQLTFDGEKLADVEVSLRAPQGERNLTDSKALSSNAPGHIGAPEHIGAESTLAFECDASNLNHVTGLVMAMEHHRGHINFPFFDVINTHRQALENGSSGSSPKVNAAIQSTVKSLWGLVGLGARESYYCSKILRGGYRQAHQFALQLFDKLAAERQKTGFKKGLSKLTLNKTREMAQVKELLNFVQLMQNNSDFTLTDTAAKGYKKAEKVLLLAQSPNNEVLGDDLRNL